MPKNYQMELQFAKTTLEIIMYKMAATLDKIVTYFPISSLSDISAIYVKLEH